MVFFTAPFRLIYKHRRLLWVTTLNDLKIRFAGSTLGLIWFILYPLMFLSLYAVVYVFIFKVRFELFTSYEYVILIFCGLIPFLSFSESLGTGIPSIVANVSLVKNTLYPIELIPTKSVLSSQGVQIVGMVLIFSFLSVLGKLTPYSLLVVPVWIFQILFTIGLIWIVSSLNVYIRDLQNITSIIVLFLMMVSPIAYTPEMIPDNLRPFLAINPLYYFITAYQELLMLGKYPGNGILFPIVALGFGFFIFGYWFVSKMKKLFADNI
jgi:lipopolysaccharide transport system permease protein